MNLRPDLAIIAEHVAPGSRILDVGCGDGALMAALRDTKGVDARGLEIDAGNVAAAVSRGLSVIQGDADRDLAEYPDASFDYAILSQTLQTAHRPDVVLDHLLRIGQQAFVSFPNFAHWRVRLSLLWGGRMPVTRLLPERWYDTPNIHHVTIDDFRSFVAERGIEVEGAWFLSGDKRTISAAANMLAEHAVFKLRKLSEIKEPTRPIRG
ncbi:methionine biosynthesis protein MetW [Sphingomonas psychrolutea]|uniref:Methionine biosynthesis protein MetW n=1 Tax=Sphingomonas psychrolutea TaxID=1259676 RepID=A0ABQ1GIG3_9SPHN|nr:methionine biosynthesis protein MetW [Sphingomonas psychrolutea]GGA44455.1 methionine biosynthesis protein MetW [Sphingomonas psychrolutea]